MEADGVLEGFLNSVQMHGLKFNKLIGIKYLQSIKCFLRWFLRSPIIYYYR